MIEKTGVIGGLYLPEKAEHSRERETVFWLVIFCWFCHCHQIRQMEIRQMELSLGDTFIMSNKI